MQLKKNKLLQNNHPDSIINRTNPEYLKLFEKFNDLVSNVSDENLRHRIMLSHIAMDDWFFKKL